MTNTCSIKFLPKAYIGVGIRMTSDKDTVEFDNKPMKGLKIENYNKQGFRISHPSMPKSFWVDFDQLPLTRLTIRNGVIDDEITFVENIINHRMQLIRTLDTEYVDLIYKEKALEQKKDQIIPISQAIPGQVYIGAQCEEGNEMIFLGNFFTKPLKIERNYYSRGWGRSEPDTKYYFHKSTPEKAFFAIPTNELSKEEDDEISEAYWGPGIDSYNNNMSWEERTKVNDNIRKEKEKTLKNSTIRRYKIVDYAITSKRIKEVIITNKENKDFCNIDTNKEVIAYMSNYLRFDKSCAYPSPKLEFKLTNRWPIGTFLTVSKNRENAELEAREIGKKYYNSLKFEDITYEDYMK